MCVLCVFFFFKQKTAYEVRISDWSSDVCSSDLRHAALRRILGVEVPRRRQQRKPGQVALAAQREAEREETAHAVAEQHRRRGFLRPQSIQRALKAAGDRKSTRLHSSH